MQRYLQEAGLISKGILEVPHPVHASCHSHTLLSCPWRRYLHQQLSMTGLQISKSDAGNVQLWMASKQAMHGRPGSQAASDKHNTSGFALHQRQTMSAELQQVTSVRASGSYECTEFLSCHRHTATASWRHSQTSWKVPFSKAFASQGAAPILPRCFSCKPRAEAAGIDT